MKEQQTDIKVYQVKDVMRILGLGKDKVYALMHDDSFPSMQIGKTYCITQNNLEKWLNNNINKNIII